MKITLEFSRKRATEYIHTLRKRYNRPRAGLRNLASMAVREIVEFEQNDTPYMKSKIEMLEEDNG